MKILKKAIASLVYIWAGYMIFTAMYMIIFGSTRECRKDLKIYEEILRVNGIDPIEYGLYSSDGFFRIYPERLVAFNPFGERITYLNMQGNKYKTLPVSIGKLTELTSLNLHNNNLTTLPKEIGNLYKLTELNLENNDITSLPDEIGRCTSLVTLNLVDNDLTTLPNGIGGCKNLKNLDISNNKMIELPASIGELTKLTTLKAGYNQLSHLPLTMEKMVNLSHLILDSNMFVIFPAVCTTMAKQSLSRIDIWLNPVDTSTIPMDVLMLDLNLDYINACREIGTYRNKEKWIAETTKFQNNYGPKSKRY